jgi:hypothetical protein
LASQTSDLAQRTPALADHIFDLANNTSDL